MEKDKSGWSEEHWRSYFLRLNELRRSRGLKKGQLSRLAGVRNLYRKDIDRPGKKSVERLCREFDVSEAWLLDGEGEKRAGYFRYEGEAVDRVRQGRAPYGPPYEGNGAGSDLLAEIWAIVSEMAAAHPDALKDVRIFLEGFNLGLKAGKRAVGISRRS